MSHYAVGTSHYESCKLRVIPSQCPTSHYESCTETHHRETIRTPRCPSTYPKLSISPCLRLGGAYTHDPRELVRCEAGPFTTSLPGPWSKAPNVPPGSPGCARPMSLPSYLGKARPWALRRGWLKALIGRPSGYPCWKSWSRASHPSRRVPALARDSR